MKILFIAILIFILSVPAFACDNEEESHLRYNPLEDTWGYEDPESHLKYNPLEDRWEYAR